MTSSQEEMRLMTSGPKNARHTLILAHGAGAAMDSDWMNAISDRLAAREIRVVRFEFPYMRVRRRTGSKRPPDRAPKLIEAWHEAIELVGFGPKVFIGGKSMGGRMASLVASDLRFQGLICLGFPFHAPGKPLGDRADHLKTIETPTLIVQGERDSFGSRETIAGFPLAKSAILRWLADGDHSFKPRKKSGVDLETNLARAADWVREFMDR